MFLGFNDVIAMLHAHPIAKAHAFVLLRLIGGDDDFFDAFGHELGGHLLDRKQTGGILSARHGHGGVVEDLVGHGDATGDRCLHRQLPGVEERTVAQVLVDVRDVHERCHTHPVHAFATHLGDAGELATVLMTDLAHHTVATNSYANI